MPADKQKGLPAQAGVSLIITFFIMVIILAVVLSVSTLLYSEIKVIKNIGDSVVAFYAADSGTEKVLYYDRQVLPDLPGKKVAVRGVCSLCYDSIKNPDGCEESGTGDSSIYCNNCSATPLDNPSGGNPPKGCDPDICNNCKVEFNTAFNDRTYYITAIVSPSEDEESSDFEINSKGSFNNVVRQINIKSTKAQAQEGTINMDASVDKKSIAKRETITISADIIASNVITKVFATIWDLDGNTYEIDLPCTGGPCSDLDNPDYSSGRWSGEWNTNSPGVYYASVTAQDSLKEPNIVTENISNNSAGQAFEVFPAKDTSYPTLSSASVTQDSNSVIINAEIYDISGVFSAIATIKAPDGTEVIKTMNNITGDSFATDPINTTGHSGIYNVDIFVEDNFFIEHTYVDATNFTVGLGGGDWLAGGWNYRKKITIDKTNVGTAGLSDFPLYVKIAPSSQESTDLSRARSNGFDIRFTADDGITLLPYEREGWSGGGGSAATGDFWVKVPAISGSASTDIYIYYGNSAGPDGENKTGDVWDANYKAVYHLNGVSGNKWADSTSNKNDGNNNGATTTTGKISSAANFANDPYMCIYMTCSYIESKKSIDVFGDSDFTTEAWVLPGPNPSNDYGKGIVGWGVVGNNKGNFFYYNSDEKSFEAGFWANDNQTAWGGYPNNNWYYAVNTYDGTEDKMFVNASKVVFQNPPSPWYPGNISVSNTSLKVGLDPFGQGRYYNGKIDEVRISSIARSADWIKFEYNNINNSDNELNFSAQETR